jgi:acyl-CoA synthetase (AMP-forming)/AMP-acid ligase II
MRLLGKLLSMERGEAEQHGEAGNVLGLGMERGDLGGRQRRRPPVSTLDPLAARTIPELVRAAGLRYADREAVVDGPVRLSYRELAAEVERVRRAAIGQGIRPGDRVAVWAPNGYRWLLATFGLVSAGAVLVPLNTRFKGEEAAYILAKTGARLLVVQDGFLGNRYLDMLRAAGPLPELATVVVLGADPVRGRDRPGESTLAWEDFLAAGVDAPLAEVAPDDLSDIFFTSGTTGRPKGAMLTHEQTIRLYVSWSELAGLAEGDRYLIVNPFFHTFGYKAGVIACLLRGATIVPQPVFDVDATLRLVANERITVLPGPPTLYASILAHPERTGYDLSSLRLAVTGAAVVPVALVERMYAELKFQTVLTAYGLTECSGTATMCQSGDAPVTIATTSGPAVPGVEVRVVDLAGEPLPAGEPGEVVVRGYNVMRGYFADPAATSAAIDPAGWLHTGDIGVLDERGYLRITDRLKDMFIVGGFNTYPAEIEQALGRHEKVAEVAVIGVPDERLGEVGRAYVVPRPGTELAAEEVIAYCRERLANYKVPRSVVFVTALPRNASGKVVKSALNSALGKG